jgi:caffeoyl-CoA O-methyltransferase
MTQQEPSEDAKKIVERQLGLEAYASAHTTPLPRLLQELVAETEREMGLGAGMLSGHVQGSFVQMLVARVRAKRVLEIGMFTGFTALMMAEALAEDGRVITCEIDPNAIAFARRFFDRSPYGRKIDVREGPALDTLRSLEGPFEFVFIDADKGNYVNYYEAALPLLSDGGLIVADNVLWGGQVLDPKDEEAQAIVAFNEHVLRDERVVNVILNMRDGLMVIRRR